MGVVETLERYMIDLITNSCTTITFVHLDKCCDSYHKRLLFHRSNLINGVGGHKYTR